MDSVTHVFLGAAIAQSFFGKRLGKAAFFVGGLAATLPDFDVFIHTGDVVRNHALHRHFMHSLVMVPVLAGFAVLPFLLLKRLRSQWRTIYLAAVLACATHGVLDMLTSYGTMILWPFMNRRFAMDIIAALDVIYTLILVAGVVVTLRRNTMTAARVALALSTLYMGFAVVQHSRAAAAQRELLALRGHQGAENARVLPQIGAVVNYRSLYVFEGKIYADAIRVVPFAQTTVKTGGSIERASLADAGRSAMALGMVGRFDAFSWFADGFVARIPGEPDTLGDMRYTSTPEGFGAVWGVVLERSGTPTWQNLMRPRLITRYWHDLVHPSGYLPLAEQPPGSSK